MRYLLALLIAASASGATAQDTTIHGRMICEVIDSRLVVPDPDHADAAERYKASFPLGMSLTFEYALDEVRGFSISFGETGGGRNLIAEPFPAKTFTGLSRSTNAAEFRAPYSEATLGRALMSYKGSDQLFLKVGCGYDGWRGHFVQTHVSGRFTQVVKLRCQPFVHAIDDVLARLAIAG